MPQPAYITSLDHMFGVWNSDNADERAALAETALEHNLHFVDPRHNIMGRTAFLKMVAGTQAEIPGAVYARSSEVGVQNNFCRYHWQITWKGDVIMTGFDCVELTDAGKVLKVIGFFGELNRDGASE